MALSTAATEITRFFCRARGRLILLFREYIKKHHNRKKNPEYTISHVTVYSCVNTGDTVLSTCVRDLFNGAVGEISWNLMNLQGRVDSDYIGKLQSSDMVVIGGHGAFLPDTNKNDISGWEFACGEEQYDLIKKPVIVFGVGYNYFTGQKRTSLFESNVNKLVRKSAFFGLRNCGSVREIQSFADEDIRDKIVYQPCPTMISRYLYPTLPAKKKTGKIAFNVALDRAEMRMGDNREIILDGIARAMSELYKKGYEIHFIVHVNKEIKFLDYIKRYKFPYRFHGAAAWDAEKATLFYNEMDVVVGMRGHGIWIPYGVNCHIISLGNQNKTKWFLEDIDAPDWYIDINENPRNLCETILEKFHDIHEINGEKTTQRLLESQKRLYEITCENMKKIKAILEEAEK